MDTRQPHRFATRHRRALLWTGGIVLAVVVIVVGCEIAGWPFLRGPLERQMAKSLQTTVRLDGDFRLHLLRRPEVELGHLTVGAANGIDTPHLLDAANLRLAWRWGDVWRWHHGGVLRIDALEAAALDANLLRGKDGKATWQVGPRPEPDKAKGEDAPLPDFGTLTVGNGHIAVDDRVTDVKLDVHVKGGEGGGGKGFDVTANGHFQKATLKMVAHADGAMPLLREDADAPPVALRVEGAVGETSILFDGRASALMKGRSFDGKVKVAGPSLAAVGDPLGVTLPRTPAFALDGRVARDGDIWQFVADTATIGRSRLNGDFRYDSGRKPTLLTGRLGGERLLLSDLGPAVGTGGEGQKAAAPSPSAASGKVLPQQEFDLPSLRIMDADVQAAIGELDFGSAKLAQLQDLKTHIVLKDAVLSLNDLSMRMADARITGQTQLDGRERVAKWAARLNVRNLDVAGFLKGLQKKNAVADSTDAKALKAQRDEAMQAGKAGESGKVTAYLTGLMAADIDVTGRGNSTAKIVGSLDGKADFVVRDGTISHLVTEGLGIDIAQALGVLVKGDDSLPLRCARFDTVLKDGIVAPRLAVLDSKDSTTRVQGQVNLRDETLAVRAETKPKDISPLSLRAPITVSGPLGDPSIGIEGRKLAGRALAAAALAVIATPVAAVVPFIDLGDKEKGDPCAGGPK